MRKVALVALALVMALQQAAAFQVSRPVAGRAALNILPIQASADVNGDGVVDHLDLEAVSSGLSTLSEGDRRDVNGDDVTDVADLAIVARYIGQEVPR